MPAIERWAVDFDHLDLAAAQVPASRRGDLDFRWARDLVKNRRAGRSRWGG